MSQAYAPSQYPSPSNVALGSFGDADCPREHLERRRWMAALAAASLEDLENFAQVFWRRAHHDGDYPNLSYTFLLRPEAGMLMMQARGGNNGGRFNLGEVLVTRCVISLQLKKKTRPVEGYAMVMGGAPRKAELAAFFDALLQTEAALEVLQGLIVPLRLKREGALQRQAEKVQKTKVDFFTMVRGED